MKRIVLGALLCFCVPVFAQEQSVQPVPILPVQQNQDNRWELVGHTGNGMGIFYDKATIQKCTQIKYSPYYSYGPGQQASKCIGGDDNSKNEAGVIVWIKEGYGVPSRMVVDCQDHNATPESKEELLHNYFCSIAQTLPPISPPNLQPFPYMLGVDKKVKLYWNPPKSDQDYKVVVLFRIEHDGYLKSIEVIRPSGSIEADKAAINAVVSAVPFDPLPSDYKKDILPVQFTFDYNRLSGLANRKDAP